MQHIHVYKIAYSSTSKLIQYIHGKNYQKYKNYLTSNVVHKKYCSKIAIADIPENMQRCVNIQLRLETKLQLKNVTKNTETYHQHWVSLGEAVMLCLVDQCYFLVYHS